MDLLWTSAAQKSCSVQQRCCKAKDTKLLYHKDAQIAKEMVPDLTITLMQCPNKQVTDATELRCRRQQGSICIKCDRLVSRRAYPLLHLGKTMNGVG